MDFRNEHICECFLAVISSMHIKGFFFTGRNFTSFKEDLARVLSNSGPFRKPGSCDPVGLENDGSSPFTSK